eukprot:scaffold79374_cov72-Phaeocystis_antarctica.AAC.2
MTPWTRALAKHEGALVARARGVRCGHSIIVRLLGVRVRLGLGLGSGSVTAAPCACWARARVRVSRVCLLVHVGELRGEAGRGARRARPARRGEAREIPIHRRDEVLLLEGADGRLLLRGHALLLQRRPRRDRVEGRKVEVRDLGGARALRGHGRAAAARMRRHASRACAPLLGAGRERVVSDGVCVSVTPQHGLAPTLAGSGGARASHHLDVRLGRVVCVGVAYRRLEHEQALRLEQPPDELCRLARHCQRVERRGGTERVAHVHGA